MSDWLLFEIDIRRTKEPTKNRTQTAVSAEENRLILSLKHDAAHCSESALLSNTMRVLAWIAFVKNHERVRFIAFFEVFRLCFRRRFLRKTYPGLRGKDWDHLKLFITTYPARDHDFGANGSTSSRIRRPRGGGGAEHSSRRRERSRP